MESALAGDFTRIEEAFPPDVDIEIVNRKDEDGRTALVCLPILANSRPLLPSLALQEIVDEVLSIEPFRLTFSPSILPRAKSRPLQHWASTTMSRPGQRHADCVKHLIERKANICVSVD